MITSHNESISFSYLGERTFYYFSKPQFCKYISKEHILAYVYSGEVSFHDGKSELVIQAGNCAFIKKNHRVKFSSQDNEKGQIKVVFLIFSRKFILEFYQKMDKSRLPNAETVFTGSFLSIRTSPDVESLFNSMIPYINSSVYPTEEVMGLKLTEGIYALLNADIRTSATLFDFIEPWKIDILDFLNDNYMYDLSLKEIATFTGRSLATFKRDFRKISNLSPQKWITKKRLEIAHQQMNEEGKTVSHVYLEVGFKSLSHFSTAYKKQFGVAPTK